MRKRAALWGTSVGYTETYDSVVIETIDGRIAVITVDTFNYLYFRLDEFTAALKEDCIEYTMCSDERTECAILRNHQGMIKHMDIDTLGKYYDIGGEWA